MKSALREFAGSARFAQALTLIAIGLAFSTHAVRAVIGWGGKGQRGDTERIGQRLLSNLQQQVLVSGLQVSSAESPARGDATEGMVCGHCGFDARGTGAFYCPKCGMKLGGTA